MTIDPTTLPASPYTFSVDGLKLQKRDPIVDTKGELWTCSHTAKRGRATLTTRNGSSIIPIWPKFWVDIVGRIYYLLAYAKGSTDSLS